MRKAGIWLLLLGLVVGIGPVGFALLAGSIAGAAGCELNEGAVHACLIAGVNVGGLLYFFGVLGWLSLATLPIGAIMFLAGLLMAIIGSLPK